MKGTKSATRDKKAAPWSHLLSSIGFPLTQLYVPTRRNKKKKYRESIPALRERDHLIQVDHLLSFLIGLENRVRIPIITNQRIIHVISYVVSPSN